MLTKGQKLERIAGYWTAYEVAAERTDGRRFLVGYTQRPTRLGLLACMQSVGQQLIDACQIGENDVLSWHGRGKLGHYCQITSGWTVRYSRRTQREAIIAGELPPVGEVRP